MSESESETGTEVVAIGVFEGDLVTASEGRLPAITFEMPDSYARHTVLRMMIEVRVKNVRYEEGRKGELTRQHVLALESIALKSAFQPHEAQDSVGGSASATPTQTPEQAEELGVEIGRTSDQWSDDSISVGF
jgi:hypothetical protein